MIKYLSAIALLIITYTYSNDSDILKPSNLPLNLDEMPSFFDKEVSEAKFVESPLILDAPIIDSLYMVGPGDVFDIHIEAKTISTQINAEGKIVLKKYGVFDATGKNLKETKDSLLILIKDYENLSRCFISLKNPKKVRVVVSGSVSKPGIYEIPSTYRITDALERSHGFNNDARKSLIFIKSSSGDSSAINISNFYKHGDLTQNPYVKQGTIIHVPPVDYNSPFVTIRFQKWDVTVQLEKEETLLDLIQKFNSYQFNPPRGTVILSEPEKRPKIVNLDELSTYSPVKNSLIEISTITNEIYVGGAVQAPGFFPYDPNKLVSSYLAMAGLMTSSKLSEKVLLNRKGEASFKVIEINKKLKPGDAIYIKENIETKFTIYAPILISLVSMTFSILTFMTIK